MARPPTGDRPCQGAARRLLALLTEAAERRRLLLSLFEQVWAQDGRIVAVQPRDDFLPYSQAASRCRKPRGVESGSDGNENSLVDPIEIRTRVAVT